ncbi:MAG: hypothetical protein IJW99_08010 [Clostridia bacterium]|nr:hypothetical protein [Clostridia bacterium]
MLRTLSVLLCLLMLSAALIACNSQGAEDETTVSDTATTAPEVKTLSIAVEEYALIRPDLAPQAAVDAAVLLNKTVTEKLGKNFRQFTDDFVKNESEIDAAAYEILVGNTNRPESAEAMKDVSFGYVIAKVGNKIVINASVSSLLDDAMDYFIETYLLPTAGEGTFSIPEELYFCQAAEDSVVLLNESNKSNFTIIFKDGLDNIKSATEPKDRTDYVVNKALELRNDMMRQFKNVNIPLGTDWVGRNQEPDSKSFEIVVGRTNRPEMQQFLETLAPNEYGFSVIGNKIVVGGWSDLTIGMATELLTSSISDFTFTDANGNKNLAMAAGTRVVKAYENWDTSIPTYDGGVFEGVMEGLDSCYELYYTGATVDGFKAYRAKLEAAGYKLHQENQIGNNLFATYYDDKNMVHAYYVDYIPAVRIVTEPMSAVNLPANEDPYTKITDTTFTMLDLDYEAGNFGNAFIITLEDGSFIVHDGGGTSGQDKTELYNSLKRLNKRTDGKIHIAAWIISHEHWDHFENFFNVCNSYSTAVVLDQVIYNVARTSINYNSNNPGSYIRNGSLKGLSITTGCKLTKLHTGQTVQVRNLKIECLYTQEDLYPTILHTFNDSCMVTRFDIGGQRFTILGDIEDEASGIMCKMYDGKTLKTDIMQVAHHGWGGTTKLYRLFEPAVLMWPTDSASFAKQTAGTSSGYYYTIDFALSKQGSVELIVVADGGHKTVALPMKTFTEASVSVMQPTRK